MLQESHFQTMRIHAAAQIDAMPLRILSSRLSEPMLPQRHRVPVTPSGAGKVRRSPRHLSPTQPDEANGHGCTEYRDSALNQSTTSQTLECSSALAQPSRLLPPFWRLRGMDGRQGRLTNNLRKDTFFLPLVQVFVPAQGRLSLFCTILRLGWARKGTVYGWRKREKVNISNQGLLPC